MKTEAQRATRESRFRAMMQGVTHRLRLNEALPLASLALVGLLGWGFVALAGEVLEGDTHRYDRAILLALRNPANLSDPIGPGWLEESARDFTGLGGYAILGFMIASACTYLLMTGRRKAVMLLAASVGGGMVLSTLLKLGFDRPRPDLVPHAVRVYTASFPSGHAMLSATTYLTLGVMLARFESSGRVRVFLVALALTLTVLVGLSRIYLGVHWPSDVLAGWCGGAGWAALCWYVALLLQTRGKIEPESETR